MGPKIGYWGVSGPHPYLGGVNLITYTNLHKVQPVVRFDFGFGGSTFKVGYGYNAIIGQRNIEGINKHVFQLANTFKVKELSR
jgi:hypothetical protein